MTGPTALRSLLFGSGISALVVLGACVGDNPSSGPIGGDAGNASSSSSSSSSGSSGSSGDASMPNDGGTEGSTGDAGPCSPTGVFGNVAEVPGLHLAGARELAVRFSSDGLSALIARTTGGVGKLYIADRSDTTMPFGTGTELSSAVNLQNGVGRASFADAKNTIFFEGTDAQQVANLYSATRSSASTLAFSNAQPISGMSGFGGNYSPYFVDGTLYLMFNPGDGTGFAIDYATRTGGTTATFSTKQELANLHGGNFPVVTSDELTIFFNADNRMKQAGRTKTTDAFGTATELPAALNTGSENPSDVSPDGCILYFTRDVGAERKLFQATRAK